MNAPALPPEVLPESNLHAYLTWCTQGRLDPLAARRPHVELYVRWMQEARHYAPSTVSRRMSIVAGFYRTCVIDEVLEHPGFIRRFQNTGTSASGGEVQSRSALRGM